jgi:hypothetical protein
MKAVAVAAAILILTARGAAAEEPRQRVMDIPLDMPLEQPLDGEFLEGIYQEKLGGILKDSVLIETPIHHIESRFTENRALELWFSSAEDGRRVFWAHLSQGFDPGKELSPETARANFVATFGTPDKIAEAKSDISGSWILLKIDPQLPEQRRAAILRQLDATFTPIADQVGDFPFLDMRERVKLLGVDFRGAIFCFTAFKGKVGAIQTDLIDMVRAHSVLNLTVP